MKKMMGNDRGGASEALAPRTAIKARPEGRIEPIHSNELKRDCGIKFSAVKRL
jgi:hypothetical protein